MEKEKYIRSQFNIKGFLHLCLWQLFLLLVGGTCCVLVCYQCFRDIVFDFSWILFIVGILFLVLHLSTLHAIYLIIRQWRIITITDSYIEYRFLFFPLISWKHNINEYDKIVQVELTFHSRYSSVDYHGVWLVQKGKVKIEIYQHVYENYEELIAAIPLPHVRSSPKYMYDWECIPYIHGKKKVKTRKIESKPPRDGK